MTDNGLKIIARILTAMESGSPWTDAKAALYASGLAHVPDALGMQAVTELSRTEEWRPSLAKILCKLVYMDQPAPSVGEALSLVKAAISGATRAFPPLESAPVHPAVYRAIRDMGGLQIIGQMRMGAFEKAFPLAYKEAIENWQKETVIAISRGEYVFMVDMLRNEIGDPYDTPTHALRRVNKLTAIEAKGNGNG